MSAQPAGATTPVATTGTGVTQGAGKNIMLFAVIGIFVLAMVGIGIFFALRGGVTPVEPETEITLDKETYEPGEEMEVEYTVVEDLKSGAWIGIMDSDTPHGDEDDGDAADISWQYLYGDQEATITLYAPWYEGEYDVRIYDTEDAGGVELGYVSFTVEEPEETPIGENDLLIAKTTYAPGDDILVSYTTDGTLDSSAWIGVIPSDIEHGDEATNDMYDTDYEYLSGTSGFVTLTAPDEPGEYDIRMNSGDSTGSVEVAYISFTVEE